MKKPEIILVGGGVHCKSCIDVIELEDKYHIAGIIDLRKNLNKTVLGYPIIGCDDDIPKLAGKYHSFLITVGQIESAAKRIKLYKYLKSFNVKLPVIVSPIAYVSKHAKISEGTIIMHNALVDVDAHVGKNCIVNISTIIAHGAKLEDHCHVSANCVLGDCRIGSGTFIGCNCYINNGVTIMNNTIIGSNSNVLKSLTNKGIYAGNPVRLLKET